MLGAGRPFGSGHTSYSLTDALTLIFLYLYTIGPKGAITHAYERRELIIIRICKLNKKVVQYLRSEFVD